VRSNTRCRVRSASGSPASTAGATRKGSAAGENRVRSFTASSDAFPHTPHDDVV
jgi:hypothetical protein